VKIHVLSPTVAAQIAAGEVVERPASVVKELLENALDAEAERIAVEARGGGLREIKVQDDGCGIASDEVERAFERHATSKLRAADDLWAIGTLGFRGEALPSIASVAQVICITRAADEEVGTELRIAGGEVQDRVPRGCSPGTSISVRNLFYNTPVRRDYLRSEATEMSAISTVVQQYTLAYPEKRFTLLLDGRLALQTSGSGDVREVLIELYGLDVARQLLEVEADYGVGEDAISVRGMISPPGLTRSSRSSMHLFINRRAVQPRGALVMVVAEAYHTLLMKGRHPLVVLDIQVHPGAVDVNVHPTKSEVRFRYQSRVMSVVGRAVRSALLEGAEVQPWSEATPAPEGVQRRFELRQVGQAAPEDSKQEQESAWGVGHSAWNTTSRWDVGGPPAPADAPAEASPLEVGAPVTQPDQPAVPETMAQGEDTSPTAVVPSVPPPTPTAASALPPLRVVGQVGLTYIVAESPEGMYLIDQHAAHERITYERLMRQRGEGAVDAQDLLMPQTVALPPAAAELLLGNSDVLAEWGFALDAWGEGLVRVRAVPVTLPVEDIQAALLEIADYLAGKGGSTPHDWREHVLTTLSCHTSVRAGQTLSLEEMRELLQSLERCTSPRTCPHGRPTMVLLTPGQLEKQFGRSV
jgi:DNA mismatch repair protein MutL